MKTTSKLISLAAALAFSTSVHINAAASESSEDQLYWDVLPSILTQTYGTDVTNYPKQVLRHLVALKEAEQLSQASRGDEFARHEFEQAYTTKGREYLKEILAKPKLSSFRLHTDERFGEYNFERGDLELDVSGMGDPEKSDITLSYKLEAEPELARTVSNDLAEKDFQSIRYGSRYYSSSRDFLPSEVKIELKVKRMSLKMSPDEAKAFKEKYAKASFKEAREFIYVSHFVPTSEQPRNILGNKYNVDLVKVEFFPNQKALDAQTPAAVFTQSK